MRAKARRILGDEGDEDDRGDPGLNRPEGEPDDVWTPSAVARALLHAVKLAQRAAGSVGPKGYGAAWPEHLVEWEDLIGRGKTNPLDEMRTEVRIAPSAADISRMEAALLWQSRYLKTAPGPGRVLKLWIRCRATKRPFTKAVKAKGWSIATAYRARDKALAAVAIGLDRDGVPVWNV